MRAPTHLCHLLAQQAASALRASQVCGPAAPAALQALPASSQDWARALASLSTSTASTSSAASPSWSSSAVPHGSSRSRPGRPPAWRMLHTSAPAAHGGGDGPISDETISVVFVDRDGTEQAVQAPLGKNLLEVAHENEIDLEGACEGSLACSTCHVIVEDDDYFKRLPEPCDDELDMLDLAFGLTETSRLGCQIIASKDLDGLRVRIPSASRNFYVDGHKPKPH